MRRWLNRWFMSREGLKEADRLLKAWQDEMIHEPRNIAAVNEWLRRYGSVPAKTEGGE